MGGYLKPFHDALIAFFSKLLYPDAFLPLSDMSRITRKATIQTPRSISLALVTTATLAARPTLTILCPLISSNTEEKT
jgi:hypothetical protein